MSFENIQINLDNKESDEVVIEKDLEKELGEGGEDAP
jgi:hypothetical protein